MKRTVVNPYTKYSYKQMMNEAKKLALKYPEILTIGNIGTSVENRELLSIQLGLGSKKLLLVGAHHAREFVSSAYLMCIAERYASCFSDKTEPYPPFSIQELFSKVTFFIVPMLNPDGVTLCHLGRRYASDNILKMRMVNQGYEKWKANISGVDLNRQYPCFWEEKRSTVHSPASEMFKGYAPATEPEVRALMDLCLSGDFSLAATFHAKGEEIFWADENSRNLVDTTYPMAKQLSRLTGYRLAPISTNPSLYAAGFENWFRAEFSKPCFLFELTPETGGFIPHSMRHFDSLVWDKMQSACLQLAEFC